MLRCLFLVLVLLLAPQASFAESRIYRTTDEHGNVIFTDTPPPTSKGNEAVEMPPINTAPPPQIRQPAPTSEPEEPEPPEVTVTITSPANETTIPMGGGIFSVTAKTEPELGTGEQLQLFMDAEPWGEPQGTSTWTLTNVFRGGHDITVERLDEDGETIASSDPVRVYVLRPSVNNRNRR